MIPDVLIHIRHGETDWNAARRLQGSQDIPLNDTGRGQAAHNGRTLGRLLRELGREAEAFDWVVSPMNRARETMDIIRRELGLLPDGYRIEPSLRELSFGTLEGHTYEEVAQFDPDSFAGLRADKWHFVPPGGENYVMLSDRVRRSIAALSGDAIIVSHGGVFRALLGLLRGHHDQELAEMTVPQDQVFLTRTGVERWI